MAKTTPPTPTTEAPPAPDTPGTPDTPSEAPSAVREIDPTDTRPHQASRPIGVSTGRIVRYVPHAQDGPLADPATNRDWVALVVDVVDADAGTVSLTLFHPNGRTVPARDVPYSEDGSPETWHWPSY